nr:heme-binding protein [Mycobacterium asiaticum]
MFTWVVTSIGKIVEAAGSVVGYRGTEEPAHTAEKLTKSVDIRRYDARIAAETTVSAGEQAARNVGFRRLARYIFGANHQQLTNTVVQQSSVEDGQKIAMTAPVSQAAAGAGDWVIRFFMPADQTLGTLPEPDDADIKLVTIPPETVAVRRFSGNPSAKAVATQTEKLLNTLVEFGFEATGTPSAWFYDPPWTLPALRRNEIAVPVRSSS